MALHRNFVSYEDYFCGRCSPSKYKSWWECAEKKCNKDQEGEDKGGCACERFSSCHKLECGMEFASFIHKDGSELKCGDGLSFRRVLSSDGCGWSCASVNISLERGVYYINLFGIHDAKCGGTIAICCNNERLAQAYAYLIPCNNSFYINTMIRIEKRVKISVRNVSDSLIKIQSARLNIFRLV